MESLTKFKGVILGITGIAIVADENQGNSRFPCFQNLLPRHKRRAAAAAKKSPALSQSSNPPASAFDGRENSRHYGGGRCR